MHKLQILMPVYFNNVSAFIWNSKSSWNSDRHLWAIFACTQCTLRWGSDMQIYTIFTIIYFQLICRNNNLKMKSKYANIMIPGVFIHD